MKSIPLSFAVFSSLAFFGLSSVSEGALATFTQGETDPFTGSTYANVDDAWMSGFNADTKNQNFGQRTLFYARDTSVIYNTVMRYDLTSMDGEFSSIESVTLRLYLFADATDPGSLNLFLLDSANAGWVEGPGEGSVAGNNYPGTVTWNELARGTQGGASSPNGTGTAWAGGANAAGVSGTDHAAAALSTVTITGSETAGSAVDFVFGDTTMISAWAAGANPGLVLKSSGISTGVTFYSSETGTFANRPELIIEYTPVPEPLSAFAMGFVALFLGALFRRS